MNAATSIRIMAAIGGAAAFLIAAAIFLAAIGRPPLGTLSALKETSTREA